MGLWTGNAVRIIQGQAVQTKNPVFGNIIEEVNQFHFTYWDVNIFNKHLQSIFGSIQLIIWESGVETLKLVHVHG